MVKRYGFLCSEYPGDFVCFDTDETRGTPESNQEMFVRFDDYEKCREALFESLARWKSWTKAVSYIDDFSDSAREDQFAIRYIKKQFSEETE